LEEIEALDPDGRHYKRLKADLDDRLYRMYDNIDDQEQSLIEARAKKQSIESEKVTGDNIYKILIYFDKFYSLMNEEERRKLMESLIEEIQIYEERQPNGQWLKSITFRLPIIEKDMKISVEDGLDSEQHIETVCLLTRLSEAKTNHVSVQD
jgi:site-specific DNA recombinase